MRGPQRRFLLCLTALAALCVAAQAITGISVLALYMTPVFLIAEKQDDDTFNFYVDCPPQSPTVRGLASILVHGLNGSTLEELLSVPGDFFLPMKLDEAVSQQRLNGFVGVLAHMKQAAVKAASQ